LQPRLQALLLLPKWPMLLLLLHVLLPPPLVLLLQPEGEGRYEWADGSSYEGGWKVRPVLLAGHMQHLCLVLLSAAG
jgi:hypothetical protein